MSGSELFFRNFVPPLAYKEMLDKELGSQWTEWEPETILREIFRLFHVVPNQFVQDKIFALQTYLNTHLFWDDVLAFENITLAFGDRYVDPDLIQGCLPDELAYGMVVAMQVGKNKDTFIDGIIKYIQECHREAGVLVYHPALSFAQPEYTGESKKIAERVADKIRANVSMPVNIDEDDPVQVQLAKTWDVTAYVQERLDRGTTT